MTTPTLTAPLPEQHPSALQLADVTVHFGGVAAISGVALSVSQGEIVAVVGPNGAGKTTLLNSINGLLRAPVTGSIEVFGEQVSHFDAADRRGLGVGRSFQDPPLLATSTVLENLLVGAHHNLSYGLLAQVFTPWRVRAQEAKYVARGLKLLRACGIDHMSAKPAGSLSYGNRKLVDIVRAMCGEPRLLLLDEPTSGLDKEDQQRVVDLLRELNRTENVTMLVVEHHMDVVQQLADRVVTLQAGMVLATGTATSLGNLEPTNASVDFLSLLSEVPAQEER